MTNELQVINERLDLIANQIESAKKTTRLNDSLFSPELAPHYSQLAVKLAQSNVIPKSYIGKPTDIFVAMAMGYQLGLPVEQAIQDIAVINGRPCVWGDGLLAIIMNHPDFMDIIESQILEGEAVIGYRCTVKRRNRTDTVRQYTLKEAKKAGLLGKPGPWTQYTERMLQMRARSWAARDSFPDALRGIKSREEAEDYIDGDYSVVPSVEKGESRTATLKKQLNDKKDLNHENIESVVNTIPQSEESMAVYADNSVEGQAGIDQKQHAEVDAGKQDTSPYDEDYQHQKVNPERITEITEVIDDMQITQERLQKALEYYQVKHISEMTNEMADDFIKRLQIRK